MKTTRIASKFNILIIFLILLTAIGTGGFVIWQYQVNSFKHFAKHGREIARMLAKNSEYGVYTENRQSISQATHGLEETEDVAYLAVFNKDKKVLYSKAYRNFNPSSLTNHMGRFSDIRELTKNYYVDPITDKQYIDIIVPVLMRTEMLEGDSEFETFDLSEQPNPAELIGFVRLGISQDRIYQDAKTFLLDAGIVASLITILGTFLTLWQTKRITSPIKSLVLATQAISQGNFGKKMQIFSNDEIGKLAISFNTMSAELGDYHAEVIKNQETLEQQVAHRTKDLQEATHKAYQLADDAEAASIAKSQFLATMSHEIRTPMNGVIGMTELLMHTKLNQRQTRLSNTILHSANSLLGIINNILDFSKIEAGKLQLVPTDFDLRQLLEETLNMLAGQAHRKGLELILNIPPGLDYMARGDAERLRQVFINLLGNAIKFTEQGEVQLKLSGIEPADPNEDPTFLFEISDTGPGIPADKQPRIFESFTQTDGSITRPFGGTGLGLTISQQLIDMMGSEIKLKSTLGTGSCFYFTLGLETSSQPPIKKADLDVLQGLKILVVDDNLTNREILHDQLASWGVQSTCVESGADALDQLRGVARQNNPYRVALLDWHMPEMDGLTLASAIQAEPLIPPLSLIMLSSDSIGAAADNYDQHGISYYLNKPIFQQQLLDCLLKLLGALHGAEVNLQHPAIDEQTQINGYVLLAEDNPVNQEVAGGMLRAIGCRVRVVNNGLEAVNATVEEKFDLILMDFHMPELDGMEATARIRKYEQSEPNKMRIPIVALTADVQKGIQEQCFDAGMDSYLSKPFRQEQLRKELEKWLAHKTVGIADIDNTPQKPAIDNESAHSILDTAALEQLRTLKTSDGANLLDKAIDLFSKSAPEEIDKMQQAIQTGDAKTLGKIAHRLKSSCANLGAQSLADDCSSLERLGKEDRLQGAEAVMASIEADLPMVLEALTKEHSSFESSPKPSTALQENRILLVDDDPDFRLITGEALRSAGFFVDEANSGFEALPKIQQQIPDLILLDALMDDMDGFETCETIRGMPGLDDTPIMMTTGLDDLDSVNRAFDVGASDFIVKPLHYKILIHRLQFILRAGQHTAALRTNQYQLAAAQRIARLGYWNWDIEHKKFQLSAHLARLCSLDQNNPIGTLDDFIELVHPEDRAFVKDAIHAAKTREINRSIEYRLQADQSSPIIVKQEIEVIPGNSGAIVTGTVQDISQQKETEKQIHRLAYFDELTGLASRAHYQDRIEEIISNAKRRNEKFAFLFLDLDGFKNINDSFGHKAGDLFLQAIAKRLKIVIRDIDFAARLGGDEFCIILNNVADEKNVSNIANRCLQEVNRPLVLDTNQVKPRVSIGIALFPEDGANEPDLMKAADAAMYAAKEAGKQRFSFYRAEMLRQAKQRLLEEQMLREAFAQEQFILHYQPQICLQTGRMVSVEALIRWQHPERGMIPPVEFIPVAERLGLIDDLGKWVLRAACRQTAKWHQSGLPLRIAVNISPIHFRDPAIVETVRNILYENDLQAEYLELEVTESAMQTEGNLDVFKHLRELGVKIAIDDFGTGFSSLATLNHLPIDCLKVDRMFIQDVLTNPQTPLLLGTIIGLANALNYTIVAEGVETHEQALVIRGLGCHLVQGFYFSRPVPENDVRAMANTDFALGQDVGASQSIASNKALA